MHSSVSGFSCPELEKLLESFIENYRCLSCVELFYIAKKLLKMIYENMYMTENVLYCYYYCVLEAK